MDRPLKKHSRDDNVSSGARSGREGRIPRGGWRGEWRDGEGGHEGGEGGRNEPNADNSDGECWRVV